MSPVGNTRSLEKGEKLFHERDASREIYFLRVGTLLLFKGDILIGQVQAPSFVGEIGPILNVSRSSTMIAKTPVSLDVFDGKELVGKLSLRSDLGEKLVKSLAERFEMIRDRLNEYQYAILGECLKILALMISEKKVSDRSMNFSDIKAVRREMEVALDQMIMRKDGIEDYAVLIKMAKQYGLKEKYELALKNRFASFQPIDLKPYRRIPLDATSDFKQVAQLYAEKILVLTRYLADFHSLGLGQLESEIVLIEEALPFNAREQIMKELLLGKYAHGSLDDFRRQITEFDRTIKALCEESGRGAELPLAPIAKKFNLEQEYIKALQAKWKEYLAKSK